MYLLHAEQFSSISLHSYCGVSSGVASSASPVPLPTASPSVALAVSKELAMNKAVATPTNRALDLNSSIVISVQISTISLVGGGGDGWLSDPLLEELSVACRVRNGPLDRKRELSFLETGEAAARSADAVRRLMLDRWADRGPPTQSEGDHGVGGAVDATRAAPGRLRKQPRADAPFGLVGDDNGPGSEPPPQDRIGLFMAVMPSRQRPPAAVGKPSFPYFNADYLPDDVCRPRRPTIFLDIESPRLNGVRKIRRHQPKPPESEKSGRRHNQEKEAPGPPDDPGVTPAPWSRPSLDYIGKDGAEAIASIYANGDLDSKGQCKA
ncbi:hypothetical protein THAOC_16772, partial [Thalassiosira oceanica]